MVAPAYLPNVPAEWVATGDKPCLSSSCEMQQDSKACCPGPCQANCPPQCQAHCKSGCSDQACAVGCTKDAAVAVVMTDSARCMGCNQPGCKVAGCSSNIGIDFPATHPAFVWPSNVTQMNLTDQSSGSQMEAMVSELATCLADPSLSESHRRMMLSFAFRMFRKNMELESQMVQ